jgi:large subunit ribosomal protein L20
MEGILLFNERKADMPRVRKGSARRKSHKRVLKAVKGYRGATGRNYRLAKEAGRRANANARADRRKKKGNFRSLWITRVNAACKSRGIRYSQFINGLSNAKIGLNRKMLSEIAIADPVGFDRIVEKVQAG